MPVEFNCDNSMVLQNFDNFCNSSRGFCGMEILLKRVKNNNLSNNQSFVNTLRKFVQICKKTLIIIASSSVITF